MPMSRGILETIYVKLAPGKRYNIYTDSFVYYMEVIKEHDAFEYKYCSAADLKQKLVESYGSEPFVHILDGSVI